MVMEPGYPKPLVSEFPGLTGSISAALAAPAAGGRAETVYFFKSGEETRETELDRSCTMQRPSMNISTHVCPPGDIMQSFTFPAASTPSCSKTPSKTASGSARGRSARQAGQWSTGAAATFQMHVGEGT